MSKRNDAWDDKKDELLLETVLEHIRTGSTQLKAFEEVGEKVNKTAAACGFRWNSHVRKQHKDEIEQAKKDKGKSKISNKPTSAPELENTNTEEKTTTEEPKVSEQPKRLSIILNIKSQVEQILEVITELETEEKNNVELANEELQGKYTELKKDYDEMVSVMAKFVK